MMCVILLSCSQQDPYENEKAALQKAADQKFEKVTRSLKAECDTNLLRETYKRVKQLQQSE